LSCSPTDARNRLLEPERLESGLLRCQHAWNFQPDADIPLLAAYVAHGVAESQAFIDGNKRTALISMEAFLELNGYWLTADEDMKVDWMLRLSSGLSVYALAKLIHDNSHSEFHQNLE
jgi:death-on-curing family protein